MSIEVIGITKLYGEQRALNNVSLSIASGEVVGLLGPNGAGKSTLMKIITCFIPPTEGTVKVCGYDVLEQSIEVRKNIGYLPENNPLYLDMYVHEYLEFIAGVHHIEGNRRKLIEETIALTGLTIEQNKKIGQLSKGYRQRVGLAQALMHKPSVMILDEPTSGLDPNQLIEIRSLIKEIGKERTVMLSTHIMQEVEAVCSRVIIIDKGNIVANTSVNEVRNFNTMQQTVMVEFAEEVELDEIKKIQGVKSINALSKKEFEITAESNIDIRPNISRFASEKQLTILSLKQKEQKLEDLFHRLTM